MRPSTSSVSEFSAKMSKHVVHRFSPNPVMPLTEANLYKHTVQSPPSREAKLKHILDYVELQRQLITLEEDLLRSGVDHGHGHWHQAQAQPSPSDLTPPKVRPRPQSPLLPLPTLPSRPQPPPMPAQNPQRFTQPRRQYNRPQEHVPAALDPSMALPRALPRTMTKTHHDQTLHCDSFYSGIGQDSDWRQLEELDPDSLAGIQIYGADHHLAPSSPTQRYPAYEHNPASDWHQERLQQQAQQQAIFRQLQHMDDDEHPFEGRASRLQFQHPRSPSHQHQHPPHPPTPSALDQNPVLKEKKSGRFSRFSFMTRKRVHDPSETLPSAAQMDPWDKDPHWSQSPRHPTMTSVTAQSIAAAAAAAAETARVGTPMPQEKIKPRSKVKQMWQGVFGRSKKHTTPDSGPFRDISLPMGVQPPTPGSGLSPVREEGSHAPESLGSPFYPGYQQPRQDHGQTSAVHPQDRRGHVSPAPRSSPSPNHQQNRGSSYQRHQVRESLVDPVHLQNLSFQKMELDEEDEQQQTYHQTRRHSSQVAYYQDPNVVYSPFAQASLTPPPASSVLRHSTSSPRILQGHGGRGGSGSGLGEFNLVDSSPSGSNGPGAGVKATHGQRGAGGGGGLGIVVGHPGRPSSQMMPIRQYDGCDSPTEPYSFHQTLPSYDHGPTLVAMTQLQKADLEGLQRQSLVAVGSSFA